jgi:hypothetical protein
MKVKALSPANYPVRPALTAVLLILLVLLLAGCGRRAVTEPAAMTTFVGQIGDTESFIGVVSDGRTAVAYVCDGQSVSHWFRGQVSGGAFDLQSAGGARLQATVSKTLAQGQFTAPGAATLAFSANPATEPAGLYRAEQQTDDGRYVAGWVVLPDGRQRGLINKIVDSNTSISDGTSNTVVGSIPLSFAGTGGEPHIEASRMISIPLTFAGSDPQITAGSIISPSLFLVNPVRP